MTWQAISHFLDIAVPLVFGIAQLLTIVPLLIAVLAGPVIYLLAVILAPLDSLISRGGNNR